MMVSVPQLLLTGAWKASCLSHSHTPDSNPPIMPTIQPYLTGGRVVVVCSLSLIEAAVSSWPLQL